MICLWLVWLRKRIIILIQTVKDFITVTFVLLNHYVCLHKSVKSLNVCDINQTAINCLTVMTFHYFNQFS